MRGIPRYTIVWGACYTLGARYLSKNTVHYSGIRILKNLTLNIRQLSLDANKFKLDLKKFLLVRCFTPVMNTLNGIYGVPWILIRSIITMCL